MTEARTLLVWTAAAAAASVATAPEAAACSQPQAPPPPGVIQSISPLVHNGAAIAVPKDGGILLAARAGQMTDAEFESKVTVSVKAGEQTFSGALSRAADLGSGSSTWLWKPSAPLPVGDLELELDWPSRPEAVTHAFVVPIADEVHVVPKAPITVSVARVVRPDPTSPRIRCPGLVQGSSCGPVSTSEVSYPTRYVGLPEVSFKTEDITIDPKKFAFVRTIVRLYSKDASGALGQVLVRAFGSPAGSDALDRAATEYCASVTVTSLFDATREEVTEACISHGLLDLAVTEEDQDQRVSTSVKDCKNPVYPEGYSSSNPGGAPAAGGSDGCAVAPARAGGGGVVLTLAAVLAFARRRRVGERTA